MFCPPIIPLSTASNESDLKDERVVLYQLLNGAASSVVLPIRLEQCGTKHYGQVVEVHLVQLRKTLHAETSTGRTHICMRRHK